MRSGRVATSQAAGTIQVAARGLRLVALGCVALLTLVVGSVAQTAKFSAPLTVAPVGGGPNYSVTFTVPVTVLAPTAIRSFSVPFGFQTVPEFLFLGQTGCTADGTTVVPANTVCTVNLRFNPKGPGQRTASLQVADGNGGTTSFGLSGTGYYPQIVVTPSAMRVVAGIGPSVSSPTVPTGDGGTAAQASIIGPQGIVADSFGNIYFTEVGRGLVRMLDAFGNITTVAGVYPVVAGSSTQFDGAAADGKPATQAILHHPVWLALDAAGDLYISDSDSNVVRRVRLTGDRTISTYVGDYTTATLNRPQGIVFDATGNLIVADSGNHLLRSVDPTTGTMTTIAGNGTIGFDASPTAALSAHLAQPYGLAIDAQGSIYISDPGYPSVRKLFAGTVSVVAGTGSGNTHTGDGGLATAATFVDPGGLAVSPAGDLYIVDTGANVVRKVESSTGIIETIAGSNGDSTVYSGSVQPATSVNLNAPVGIAFDPQQNLYLAEDGNNIVREIPTAPGELDFAALAQGSTSAPLTLKVANIGNAPAAINSVTTTNPITSNNFQLANNGTAPCTGTLAAGTHCAFTVSFVPSTTGFIGGEIDITDTATETLVYPTIQPVYLNGGTRTPLTIGPSTLPQVVAGAAYIQAITTTGGFGAVTVTTSGTLPPGITATASAQTVTLSGTPATTGTYTYTVYATDVLGDTAEQVYTLTVLPQTISYNVSESITVSDGVTHLLSLSLNVAETVTVTDGVTELPGLSLNVAETITTTDTQMQLPGLSLNVLEGISTSDGISELPSLTLAIQESITLLDQPQNTLNQIAQTITAPAVSSHAYGDSALTVSATSDSGLPVAVVVSGPATLTNGSLELTGAGTVTLTFSQAGNATYSAATPVTRSFTVFPAAVTITAASFTRVYGQPNPAFTYKISGLVHGDTAAALGGSPVLIAAAAANSPAADYPIVPTQGSIATTNYSLTFVPGTLTVTGHVAQTITFSAIPSVPLAVGALTLSAHSTSGLAIVYTVTGPATVNKNKLQLTGSGSVTVTASQPGNATFDPAISVIRSFTVTP
jgi:sugar lactone lactonase YvrE